jgi:hypothetical protein
MIVNEVHVMYFLLGIIIHSGVCLWPFKCFENADITAYEYTHLAIMMNALPKNPEQIDSSRVKKATM